MSTSAVCSHCGLPIPGAAPPPAAAVEQEPEYCCFGCRLAADIVREGTAAGELGQTCQRLGLSIFLSLNVMIFTMWLWTQDVYGPGGANGSQTAVVLWNVCRYACLVFSLPVLWMLGRPVAEEAWQSLRRGAPTTDLLLIAGTVAAYAYSLVSTIRGGGPVYFEVGCAVLVLVTVGRFLEARGKQQAAAALESLEKLLPDEVRKVVAGEVRNIPLSAVVVGDRLAVRAGERIPSDGRIVRGTASIDAGILTGESLPLVRETGDDVLGGTLNLDGDLTIEVTALPRCGTWQRLLDSMRTARQMKGRHQRLADLIARWFMPAVAVVAAATFAYHFRTGGFDQGLLAALAVVLVACPCALGLATPLAVWAGLGRAAQAQVLFRNGEALERLAGVRVAAFDKTGTLTDGRAVVEQFVNVGDHSADEVLARATAVAAVADHDLSRAVVAYGRVQQVDVVPARNVRTLPGRGLVAEFDNQADRVFVGNERLMLESQQDFSLAARRAIDRFTADALPIVCVGWNRRVQAVIGFREQLREAAWSALEACRRTGLHVEVQTGDHAARGQALTRSLEVAVRAELTPEGKVAALAELRRHYGPVAMIGDGLNDAPALTAADVGIALGCGADVSRQSADVCLLGNDLARVAWSIGLARRTVRTVRQNLFWSFFYTCWASPWRQPVD